MFARIVVLACTAYVGGCADASRTVDAAEACPEVHGPPFPEAAHLVLRRTEAPFVSAYSRCEGFEGSLGSDFCSAWSGAVFDDGTGVAYSNPHPMLATYGYVLQFDGERAQLCREFGGEWGDERGCPLSDVRCATSGELVLHDDGGGHITGDFEGGGRVEAAFRFRFPVDAGARADSWP